MRGGVLLLTVKHVPTNYVLLTTIYHENFRTKTPVCFTPKRWILGCFWAYPDSVHNLRCKPDEGVTEPNVLLYIGIGLLLFAGSVLFQAVRKELVRAQVNSIIVQDWLWVTGSVAVLAFQLFGLSVAGYLLIAFVAIIVADFALFQRKYLRGGNQSGVVSSFN